MHLRGFLPIFLTVAVAACFLPVRANAVSETDRETQSSPISRRCSASARRRIRRPSAAIWRASAGLFATPGIAPSPPLAYRADGVALSGGTPLVRVPADYVAPDGATEIIGPVVLSANPVLVAIGDGMELTPGTSLEVSSFPSPTPTE